MNRLTRPLVICVVFACVVSGCGSARSSQPNPAAEPGQDAAFTDLAHEFLEDFYRRNPTEATSLGIHKYDDQLDDYSKQAVVEKVASLRAFRDRVSATDPSRLSAANQL